MGGRLERTQGQAKMAAWNSFIFICIRGLHFFRSSTHWSAASTVIPLLPKDTFTLSIQHNLGLPRTRPPPSTPFWQYGTHQFFQHGQTISILIFYYSSPTHLYIPNYQFVTLQPNFSNTSSQEHSLSFSQHFFSYPMPLLRTTPLVQLLLHIDTSWPLSQSSIAQHTFQRSPSSIPLIHSM